MKNKHLFFILLLTSSIFSFCCAQKLKPYQVSFSDDIPVKKNSPEDFAKKYFYENKIAQIDFGVFFENEKVKVEDNEKVILDTLINTNHSTELAEKHFFVKTSEQNLIHIVFTDAEMVFTYDNRFLFLKIEKKEDKIELIYSNNLPQNK